MFFRSFCTVGPPQKKKTKYHVFVVLVLGGPTVQKNEEKTGPRSWVLFFVFYSQGFLLFSFWSSWSFVFLFCFFFRLWGVRQFQKKTGGAGLGFLNFVWCFSPFSFWSFCLFCFLFFLMFWFWGVRRFAGGLWPLRPGEQGEGEILPLGTGAKFRRFLGRRNNSSLGQGRIFCGGAWNATGRVGWFSPYEVFCTSETKRQKGPGVVICFCFVASTKEGGGAEGPNAEIKRKVSSNHAKSRKCAHEENCEQRGAEASSQTRVHANILLDPTKTHATKQDLLNI